MFFKVGVLKNFEVFAQVFSCEYCNIFKNTAEHLRTAASVLIIIKLVIDYWASTDVSLIKNITWNDFY